MFLSYAHHQAGQKLTAISRIAKFMSLEKRKLLINSFFKSQFEYCPLTWMFHSRALNNRINDLHYRALRLIYQEDTMTFNEFLREDGAVTIHHRNIQNVGIEMFKAKNNISPTMMKKIFPDRNYNGPHLRAQVDFEVPPVKSVNNGQGTLRYLEPIIWEMIPNSMKNLASFSIFKNKIKMWIPEKCPCRLCKDYIQGVGYVDSLTYHHESLGVNNKLPQIIIFASIWTSLSHFCDFFTLNNIYF